MCVICFGVWPSDLLSTALYRDEPSKYLITSAATAYSNVSWAASGNGTPKPNRANFVLMTVWVMLSSLKWVSPHQSGTFNSVFTALKRMKLSEKLELTAQAHSWQMELEARQSQHGVINGAIYFWMQFVRAWIPWSSGHAARAMWSAWHFLGNRNRTTKRFLRGIPQFRRYLGSQVTEKAYFLKKGNKVKINEDMHHLIQFEPKSLWKTCVTTYSF